MGATRRLVVDGQPIEVRRSAKRRRTVTAFREAGTVVIAIPDRFDRAEEKQWVDRMLARLQRKESSRRPSDAALAERAEVLSTRYLDGAARPTSVAWSDRQNHRWGSCTPADGSIRLSERLRPLPDFVLDYVLLHELAHLLEPGHGQDFWQLLAGYPETERARGFLQGHDWAIGMGREPDAED